MKCVYIFLLVTVAQGYVIEQSRVTRETNLKAPKILALTAVDPPGYEVRWSTVNTDDEKDPVLGYKVYVWEMRPAKTYKYEVVEGEKKLVETNTPTKFDSSDITDEVAPIIIDVKGPDSTKTLVSNVQLNALYETKVRAYTSTVEGPLSDSVSIQLKSDSDTDTHQKDRYEMI